MVSFLLLLHTFAFADDGLDVCRDDEDAFLWEATLGGSSDLVEWTFQSGMSQKTDGGSFAYTTTEFWDKTRVLSRGPFETFGYGLTSKYLHEAMSTYRNAVFNKSVLIIGSTSPTYEAFALFYGAKKVTVSEYGPRSVVAGEHCERSEERRSFCDLVLRRVRYVRPIELTESSETFDAVVSVSSVEHDGLGRYGDPLAPNADLRSMKVLLRHLTVDSLFFLSVPIGKDAVVFNAHRVYGRERLPLLTEQYDVVDAFGLSSRDFRKLNFAALHQPVLVLKPNATERRCPSAVWRRMSQTIDSTRSAFDRWRRLRRNPRSTSLCDQSWCQTMLPSVPIVTSVLDDSDETMRTGGILHRWLSDSKLFVDLRVARNQLDAHSLEQSRRNMLDANRHLSVVRLVRDSEEVTRKGDEIRVLSVTTQIDVVTTISRLLDQYAHLSKVPTVFNLDARGGTISCDELRSAMTSLSTRWDASVRIILSDLRREERRSGKSCNVRDAFRDQDAHIFYPRRSDSFDDLLQGYPVMFVHLRSSGARGDMIKPASDVYLYEHNRGNNVDHGSSRPRRQPLLWITRPSFEESFNTHSDVLVEVQIVNYDVSVDGALCIDVYEHVSLLGENNANNLDLSPTIIFSECFREVKQMSVGQVWSRTLQGLASGTYSVTARLVDVGLWSRTSCSGKGHVAFVVA